MIKISREKTTYTSGAVRTGIIALLYIFLVTWAIVSLLPLYWMMTTAIKPASIILKVPPEWIPEKITLYYIMRFFTRTKMVLWIMNTLLIASIVTLGHLFFDSLAGYAFAKMRFPGRELLFWTVLASMMIPGVVTLVPLYLLVKGLGWFNTYQGLIFPPLAGAFGIFFMRQSMKTLPSSLIDAGRIDACSEFGIYWKIYLPLVKPSLAVLCIFIFIGQWNNFMWPYLITNDSSKAVIQVGLLWLKSDFPNYSTLMAGATIAAIPMFAVFFIFQKYFIGGIRLGALKG